MEKTLQLIDDLLRKEKLSAAQHRLTQIDKSHLTQDLKLRYARLARRAGLSSLSTRVLYPSIYSPKNSSMNEENLSTTEEKIEYAYALTDQGVYNEAADLLKKMPSSPSTLLCLAHLAFQEKNTTEASLWLSQIGNNPILMKEEMEIRESLSYAIHLEESPQDRAQTLLDWENFSKHHPSRSNLPVRRWKAVTRLMDNPVNTRAIEELRSIRTEAIDKKLWEEVRECDRWEALGTKNESLFWKVYFGTPFSAFKKRILRDYRPPLTVPKTFDWVIPQLSGTQASRGEWVFDLLMGEKTGAGKIPIKVGKGMHRLLTLLAQDFYHPQKISALFSQLYPRETLDPVTSAPRVHQILNRLRIWFKRHHLPLSIEESENTYRLLATERVVFRIPNIESSSDPVIVHLNKLRELFPAQFFSANEASKVLGVSGRTVLRLVGRGTKLGFISRTGKGAATRYQFQTTPQEIKRAA